MKLLNTETNQEEFFDQASFYQALGSGKYGFIPDAEYTVMDIDGNEKRIVSGQEAFDLYNQGQFQVVESDRLTREEEELQDSSTEQLKAAAEGAIDAPTMGFGTGALIEAGVIDAEASAKRKELFPGTRIGAEIATDLALGAFTGGSTLGIAGAKYLGKKGIKKAFSKELLETIGKKSIAKKLNNNAVKFGVETGAEGALRSLGEYYSETKLKDIDFDGETALQRAGFGGAIGFGLGAATGKIVDKFKTPKIEADSAIDETVITPNTIKKMYQNDFNQRGIVLNNEDGVWKYRDSAKSFEVDPDQLETKIIDIEDKNTIKKLSEITGIDLENTLSAEKIKSTVKNNPNITFEKMVLNEIKDFKYFDDNIDALDQASNNFIKKLIKSSNDFEDASYKLSKIPQELKESSREYKLYQKTKDQFLKDFKFAQTHAPTRDLIIGSQIKAKMAKKAVQDYFKSSGGIRFGNKILAKNADELIKIGKNVKGLKGMFKDLKIKPSSEKILKAIGARQADFKKIRGKEDEIADFVWNNVTTKELLTENLDEIILRKQERSIEDMSNSIIKIENALLEAGEEVAISPKRVKQRIVDIINKNFVSTETGKPYIESVEALEKAMGLADKVLDLRVTKDEYGRIISEIPYTASGIREVRMGIDRLVKNWSIDAKTNIYQDFLKDVRTGLEDLIYKQGINKGIDNSILKEYISGKKVFEMSTYAMDMLKNKANRSRGNNVFGLTSYITGGIGAAAGSTLGPAGSAVLGTAGLLGRNFLREHGDALAAMFYKSIESNNLSNQVLLKDSSINFVKNYGKNVLRGVNGSIIISKIHDDNLEQYRNDVKELEKLKTDSEELITRFNAFSNNYNYDPRIADSMIRKIQTGISFLESKIPRGSEYDDDYIPSDFALRKYNRYRRAVIEPYTVIKELEAGYITNESVEAFKNVYPKMYETLISNINLAAKNVTPRARRRILAAIEGKDKAPNIINKINTLNTIMKGVDNQQGQQSPGQTRVRQGAIKIPDLSTDAQKITNY